MSRSPAPRSFLGRILLAILASSPLVGCNSKKDEGPTVHSKPEKHAVGSHAGVGAPSNTFDSILGGKDLSKVDWDKVGVLAEQNLPEFEKFIDHASVSLQDTPETRDDFFTRCIWFVREREAKEVVQIIEQHGRGQGKKMAYGSLIGAYSEDPGRLKDFIEKMPYGEPRSKGFQRYYIETTKDVESFESGLKSLAAAVAPEDRSGIRLGLKMSGGALISGNKATADQLNSLVERTLADQKDQYGDFKY